MMPRGNGSQCRTLYYTVLEWFAGEGIVPSMSAREVLISEINQLPEAVVEEVLIFTRFAARQHEEADWGDILPGRQVEQEVLDIIDAP